MNASLEILDGRMEAHQAAGLHRRLRDVGQANGPRVTVEGRRVLLMAGNDYLGLSRHPRLSLAAADASLAYGSGCGASRLVSGHQTGHAQLERQIAAFKKTEGALFFCTGYMANLGCIGSLAAQGDYVVSDALNHASLIDACRLSRAMVKVYDHGDAPMAERLLSQAPDGVVKLIVTDGVFSMDGDLAPLTELLAVARRHGALLVIDDAHATGVWGATGRGTLEHFGLKPAGDIIQVGTMSKALGGLGGFVTASEQIIDMTVNKARAFIFTTAAPPAQVAVASEALRLVDDEPQLRTHLHELCELLRELLAAEGLRCASEAGPIIPIIIGGARQSMAVAQGILERGVLAPAIRPPTVPHGASRIRVAVSAAHTAEDMQHAAWAISRAVREAGA